MQLINKFLLIFLYSSKYSFDVYIDPELVCIVLKSYTFYNEKIIIRIV